MPVKIDPGYRSIHKSLPRPEAAAHQPLQAKRFSDMLQQQDRQASYEQLKQMIQQIDQQGQRLAKSMTVRELRLYKNMVKKFLEDTVRRGVGLKETRGWDRRGRNRRYKILDEIDRILLDMADELLEHEEGRIRLLQSIGEIRGLLINLLY
jgi:hypothetical protein